MLRLKQIDPRVEIYYWQEQDNEVDFVVKLGDNIVALVESTYELDPPAIKKKAFALAKAGKKLGCKELFLVTYGEEGLIERRGLEIKIVPYWRWALKEIKAISEVISRA